MSASPALLADLRSAVGDDCVSTDPADLEELGRDWTKVFAPAPSVVVRPRTREGVAATLRIASAANVAVVPSGGRTGLAGGAVAKDGEIVLSLARMNAMGAVDVVGRTLFVEAGAVTQAVHEHCAEHDLTWPVDFASKGSSHVGGNIATNAGGIRVIRYGLTRNWVMSLEVALASGEIVTLGGALEKDNTGVDLKQLFIGSEGILGVITGATLKLAALPRDLDTMLFAVPSLAGVIDLFRRAQHGPFVISAFEFFTDRCLARVKRHRGLDNPLPTDASHFVVLEVERRNEEATDAFIGALFEEGAVLEGTRAQHATQAAQIWALREGISESLSATGLPHKNDIALPVAGLEAFVADLDEMIAADYPGFDVCVFGHIGDGNLHVNVMKPDALDKATFLERTRDLDRGMFELVRRHRGSISAEHGIGLLKKPYLGYTRSPAQVEMMRAVKRALDPKGILNPGKIFDL